jgi:hypothetical protein
VRPPISEKGATRSERVLEVDESSELANAGETDHEWTSLLVELSTHEGRVPETIRFKVSMGTAVIKAGTLRATVGRGSACLVIDAVAAELVRPNAFLRRTETVMASPALKT